MFGWWRHNKEERKAQEAAAKQADMHRNYNRNAQKEARNRASVGNPQATKRNDDVSSTDFITNPAYMGMPGNIYHPIISSPSPSYDSSPSCDSSSSSSSDSSSSSSSSDSGGGSCGGGGE